MVSSSFILWAPPDPFSANKSHLHSGCSEVCWLYYCRAVRLITDFTCVLLWWQRTTGLPSRVWAWRKVCCARTSAADSNTAFGKKISENDRSIYTTVSNSQKRIVRLTPLPKTLDCVTVENDFAVTKKYSRAPVSTDSVSAVYRGPKKNRKSNKWFISFKSRAKRERAVTWWNPAAQTLPVLYSSSFVPVPTLKRQNPYFHRYERDREITL
jgi:hypothetical protein